MIARDEMGIDQWLAQVRSEYWDRLAEPGRGSELAGAPYVLFHLVGRRFAVDASLCKGVVRRPRITRLPAMPSHILGVAGIRGEVISVTDPAQLLGIPGERPKGHGFLLIVSHEAAKTALWVDRVADLVTVSEDQVFPLESPWPGAPEKVVVGQWSAVEPPVLVLDGRRYVAASAVAGRAAGR